MQTQKIVDNIYMDEEEEERGPVIAHLTSRADNISHDLYRGPNQIGRGTQNDVVVDHVTVSDVHAEIEIRDNNEAYVKDLRSSNGTSLERAQDSNDYVQLHKGQTLLLRNGCSVRFGLIHLTYTLDIDEEDPNDEEGDQFDVESDSDDEKGRNVQLNLDLKGVINNRTSIFDEPTQCLDDVPPLPKPRAKNVSLFDQETQNLNNDDDTEDTFQQEEGDDDAMFNEAAEILPDLSRRNSSGSIESPTQIQPDSPTQVQPSLNRDNSSVSVESPTQIQPDVMSRRSSIESIESPTQLQPEPFSRRSSAGSVESPTQIQHGCAHGSETETEGEDDNEGNVTITTDDGTSATGGTLLEKDASNQIDEEENEDSDAESDDLMMNSQAELNSDALQLILPADLPLSQQSDKEEKQDIQSINITNEQGKIVSTEEHYLTQVSPNKRVDIRVLENEVESSAPHAVEGGKKIWRRMSDQLKQEEAAMEKGKKEIARDDGEVTGGELKEVTCNDSKVQEDDDDDELLNTDTSDAPPLPKNTFPASLTNILPSFVQKMLPTPSPQPSSSANKRKRKESDTTPPNFVVDSPVAVATPVLDTSDSTRQKNTVDSEKDIPETTANEDAYVESNLTSAGIGPKKKTARGSLKVEEDDRGKPKPNKVMRRTRGRTDAVDTRKAQNQPDSANKKQGTGTLTENKSTEKEPVNAAKKRVTRGCRAVKPEKDENEICKELEEKGAGVHDDVKVESVALINKEGKRGRAAARAPVKNVVKDSKKRSSNRQLKDDDKNIPESDNDINNGESDKKRSKVTNNSSNLNSSHEIGGKPVKPAGIDQESRSITVLFTGVEADDRLRKLVTKIGGKVVGLDDMDGVTHVITDGNLKRTPKLLVALNLGACYVVGVEWLEDSAKLSPPSPIPIELASPPIASKGKPGRAGRGSVKAESYLVQDREKEKKWAPFTLVKTLQHNYKRITDNGGDLLFNGLGIYIASDVFGRNAPSREELRLIVESGGGTLLTTGTEIAKFEKQKGDNHKAGGIVIVSKEAKKAPAKAVVSFAKCHEGGQGLYSVEFLFSAVMRQEIDYGVGVLSHLTI